MTTLNYTEALVVISCGKCGIHFGVPENFNQDKKDHQTGFYCPNGHCRAYNGQTRDQKIAELEKRVENAHDYNRELHETIDHKDNQIRGHKSANTKLKKRVANGVCPCCNRTFQNLHRHMKGQHPDYTAEEK